MGEGLRGRGRTEPRERRRLGEAGVKKKRPKNNGSWGRLAYPKGLSFWGRGWAPQMAPCPALRGGEVATQRALVVLQQGL